MHEDPLRHAWLATRMDRDVRAALQAVLLWTESVEADLSECEDGGGGDCARKIQAARREVAGALSLVDDLVAVGRPAAAGDDRLWPRSIVVRDLLGAAIRTVSSDPEARLVEVERRTEPEDLRLVADPDPALQALVGLLRAAVRSSRPGERVRLEAGSGKAGDASDREAGRIDISVRAPRLLVGPKDEVERLCRGLPSPAVDPRRWPAALSLAVAGRCAGVLDGETSVEWEGEEGARALLRLPANRRPERRPGWIP